MRGAIYLVWNDGAHRRAIEKNWMFFETGEQIWATYTIRPHTQKGKLLAIGSVLHAEFRAGRRPAVDAWGLVALGQRRVSPISCRSSRRPDRT